MSKHTHHPVDSIDTVKVKGQAAYEELLPTLRPAHDHWTIAINVGETGSGTYVLIWEPDTVKRIVDETYRWTSYYVRAVGENTLGTELVVMIG